MPCRGITLGPRSGATLTHGARRPERRRFFSTHRGSLSSTARAIVHLFLICTMWHVRQERNQWALRSWLVMNCMVSSLCRLLVPWRLFWTCLTPASTCLYTVVELSRHTVVNNTGRCNTGHGVISVSAQVARGPRSASVKCWTFKIATKGHETDPRWRQMYNILLIIHGWGLSTSFMTYKSDRSEMINDQKSVLYCLSLRTILIHFLSL